MWRAWCIGAVVVGWAAVETASAGGLACRLGRCGGCLSCGRYSKLDQMRDDYAAGQASTTWHGNYYHTGWGTPVAVVVPPTAGVQTDYRWGLPASRVSRIYPQFQRTYPGAMTNSGGPFLPTPLWPSDTNQFGAYYVRGPW